jgi:colanic acid/amylovoran biosynthesis protein
MFGQGLGPLTQESLRKQARIVFPKLKALGLREDRTGGPLAASLGAAPGVVALTGDDALEDIVDHKGANGDAIGLNIRVAQYAGVDPINAAIVSDLVLKSAIEYGAPVLGLPVSRYPVEGDGIAIQELSRRTDGSVKILTSDAANPADLAADAARCRIIVTGSYHAAVFGLAQGIPTVCLTKSAYYDGKFSGLQSLFPSACFTVSLAAEDFANHLSNAINDAWDLPIHARSAARESALAQCAAGRRVYKQFRESVENSRMVS